VRRRIVGWLVSDELKGDSWVTNLRVIGEWRIEGWLVSDELKGVWWMTYKEGICKETVVVWLRKYPGTRGRMEEKHEMTLRAARPGFKPRTFWIPDYRPRQEVLCTASRLALCATEPYQRAPEAKRRAGSDLFHESGAEFKNSWSSSSILSLHGVIIL